MKQLLRRLPMMVVTLLVVSFLTFLLTSLLKGDPAVVILGPEGAKDPAAVAAVREDLHLDDPLPVRYVNWLGDAAPRPRALLPHRAIGDRRHLRRLPVTLGSGPGHRAALPPPPLGTLSAFRAGPGRPHHHRTTSACWPSPAS